jgi:hypothetical protein
LLEPLGSLWLFVKGSEAGRALILPIATVREKILGKQHRAFLIF